MAVALIALGSNVGDALDFLRQAIDRLSQNYEILGVSETYETRPMYVENQPNFLNAAIAVRALGGPYALLRKLKDIEQELGRVGRVRYGPREVDLDLIAYGSAAYEFTLDAKSILKVPHPMARERRFVMAPLFDIAPDFILPNQGNVRDLLAATNSQADAVHRRDDASLSLHRIR